MGIWSLEAYGSDDAYDLLGELEDFLAARLDALSLRAALRDHGVPYVGFNRAGQDVGSAHEPLSMDAATAALQWLGEQVDGALRQIRPTGESHHEIIAVAGLAALAALRAVTGPGLHIAPDQLEEWALWLETGPPIWAPEPARNQVRRQVAAALRSGEGTIPHTGVKGAITALGLRPLTPQQEQ